MVRLVEPKVVDHCLVIDGKRRLIIDSAEPFPLFLTEDVLRRCGGSEAKNLIVAEVRQILPVVGLAEPKALKTADSNALFGNN